MPLPFAAADVAAALVKKGMERSPNHHWMYRRRIEGVMTLVTRISFSGSEIGSENAHKMANQCALHLAEFIRLIDCTLSGDEWEDLIRERCMGGRNPFLGNR